MEAGNTVMIDPPVSITCMKVIGEPAGVDCVIDSDDLAALASAHNADIADVVDVHRGAASDDDGR